MVYHKPCAEGTPLIPFTYTFMEPVRVRIRKPDGTVVLTGFGMGEKVEVMEPRLQHLICLTEIRNEIPLADGSAIVEFPTDMLTALEPYPATRARRVA